MPPTAMPATMKDDPGRPLGPVVGSGHRDASVARPVAMEVLVDGLVQGVGYRAFAQRRARDRGLTGYAMNLLNGRVKIRVEGDRDAVDGYVRELTSGPPLARVDRVAVTTIPYTGRYREFGVRFSESS